jgi:hypothetical protein
MQIRSKTYLHLVSLWRSLRDTIPPHLGDVPADASPLLIYIAVALASLLVILEADAHRAELESLGLICGDCFIQTALLSP